MTGRRLRGYWRLGARWGTGRATGEPSHLTHDGVNRVEGRRQGRLGTQLLLLVVAEELVPDVVDFVANRLVVPLRDELCQALDDRRKVDVGVVADELRDRVTDARIEGRVRVVTVV